MSTEPRAIPAPSVLRGRLRVPPSKSLSNRYLNLALLANLAVEIDNLLISEDIELFLAALRQCGHEVRSVAGADGADRVNGRVEIAPRPGGPRSASIDCGMSGTLLRFLTGALTTVEGEWELDGAERLRERPVGPLVEALRQLGARIDYLAQDGFAPMRIRGGALSGGAVRVDAGSSSQFLSSLLMAAQRAEGRVLFEIDALTSQPYVALTLDAIERFGGAVERLGPLTLGVSPGELVGERLTVEGDYSAACYPAAGALLTGGEVALEGLNSDSQQADRGFFDLLGEMGARIETGSGVTTVAGGSASRSGQPMRSIVADLSDMPDQVPTLAALAPFADGTTRLLNVPHVRLKESDRLAAMAGGLKALGAGVVEHPDGLEIRGTWAQGPLADDRVDVATHGDHRIAMSLALVGLRRPGVRICDPQVVAKSYPEFWHDLFQLIET